MFFFLNGNLIMDLPYHISWVRDIHILVQVTDRYLYAELGDILFSK